MKNDEMHLCLIEEPENIPQEMIYKLFLMVGQLNPPEMRGKHHKKTSSGYSAYGCTLVATGRYGFLYNPEYEPKNAREIAVPEWAIEYATRINGMGGIAYEKGYYDGESAGYSAGRNMLVMLAKGEVTVDEFENYDPQKDRSRPLYRFWNGKRRDHT